MKEYKIDTLVSRKPTKRETFSGITEGRFIVVDPGTKYMGWAIVEVSRNKQPMLLDRGTIIRDKVGTESTVAMLDELFSLIKEYEPDELVIEDYMLILGKTNGVFAVPALIGIIKYEWYRFSQKEAITVKPQTWKNVICRSPSAKKIHVREAMKAFLDPDEYESIITEFEEKRGKSRGDYGEQDCIDAVAIGLYVCMMVRNEQITKEAEIFQE